MAGVRNIPIDAAQPVRSGFEQLTRIGFVAKGVVYVLIGYLALKAALGQGGETTDKKGVIVKIAAKPFGEVLLAIVGIGLLGYALWRILSAFHHQRSDAVGLGKRVYYLVVGLLYGGTAIYALKLAFGDGGGSSGPGAQTWTARVLNAPMGTLVVALIGIAIAGAGIGQIAGGVQEKFREHLRALPTGREWIIAAGKWGHIARGVVFTIIGIFVIVAAVQHDPSEVRGIEGALDALAVQPFGQMLLGFIGAGLACYGIYSILEARYRSV